MILFYKKGDTDMHNCKCENHGTDTRVNGFVDLNGIPYVLAEYLDRNNFQQIDRSQIKSEIIIDQSESMRAVVDISVDDIGKRASDGYPAIVGNNTKHCNLLKMISNNCELMNHQFNVLRRGIVIRVDYQLENYRTHQVIRSMTEEFRINDRSYFLDINPRNVNDNAIIVNFCNTIVSTINEFTHGQDPMILRVTHVHMSYEMVKAAPHMPRIKQSMTSSYQNECSPGIYGRENDVYINISTQCMDKVVTSDSKSITVSGSLPYTQFRIGNFHTLKVVVFNRSVVFAKVAKFYIECHFVDDVFKSFLDIIFLFVIEF